MIAAAHDILQISDWEIALRLGAATLLCGAVGFERERRGQAAGLRTHILVGLGAALFTLISAYGFEQFVAAPVTPGLPVARVDPTRIAAQIVAGIGFLGAGAIIREGFNVRGLTTAAALWISAALGMAAGAGYYTAALITTILVLVSLIGIRRLQPFLREKVRADIILLDMTLIKPKYLGEATTLLSQQKVHIDGMQSDHDDEHPTYRFELRLPPGVDPASLAQQLIELRGVVRVALSGSRSLTVEEEDEGES